MDFFNIDFADWTLFAFYWQTLIFIIIGYLVGSLNFGQIFSKINNTDIGKLGSKNYGATNAGRNFGIKGFIFVFSGDFLKAFLAFGIMSIFYYTGLMFVGSIAIGLFFALIGHSWPIYFKFKGGKGVATFIAVSFIINWIAALVGLLFFVLLLIISRRVAIASITFALASMITIIAISIAVTQSSPIENLLWSWSFTFETVLASIMSFGLIVYKHWSNIKNIYVMQENYVSRIDAITYNIKSTTTNKLKLIWKNLFDYYEVSKDVTSSVIKEGVNNSSNFVLSNIDKFKESKLIEFEELGVISPFKKDEKYSIIIGDEIIFSPTNQIEIIFSIKNTKQIKKYADYFVLLNIKDITTFSDVEKYSNSYKMIADVSKGKYFAERSIKSGIKILKIDPYLGNDFDKVVKLCQKENKPLILDFKFSTIATEIILKEKYQEKAYFKGIQKVMSKIESNFPEFKNKVIISIKYNSNFNIIEVVKLVSIIYKNPIVLVISKEEFYNLSVLLQSLKGMDLINYINVY